jgi:hypothetical protein
MVVAGIHFRTQQQHQHPNYRYSSTSHYHLLSLNPLVNNTNKNLFAYFHESFPFTIMVVINDMHSRNGCLRICKGRPWLETNCAMVVQPQENGNPDAGGWAGAIPIEEVNRFEFEDLECAGGTVAAFNG